MSEGQVNIRMEIHIVHWIKEDNIPTIFFFEREREEGQRLEMWRMNGVVVYIYEWHGCWIIAFAILFCWKRALDICMY